MFAQVFCSVCTRLFSVCARDVLAVVETAPGVYICIKKERHLMAASFSYMITNQSIVFPDGTSNFGRVLFFHSLPRISVFFCKEIDL